MMVLEIDLQHAESTHTLVLIQIPEFMPQPRTNLIGPVIQVHIFSISWHSSNWNSDSIHDNAKSKLLGREMPGKNRYVDELHLWDPGHNPTSSEVRLERFLQSWNNPTQFEIPRNPVCYSKDVFQGQLWQQHICEGSNKMRFQYCMKSQNSLLYIRAIQGHTGGNLKAPWVTSLWKEFLFHRGDVCLMSLQSSNRDWQLEDERAKKEDKPSSSHLSTHSETIQTKKNLRWPFKNREKFTITVSGKLLRTPSTGSIQPEHRTKNYDSGRQGLMPWLKTTLCRQFASIFERLSTPRSAPKIDCT